VDAVKTFGINVPKAPTTGAKTLFSVSPPKDSGSSTKTSVVVAALHTVALPVPMEKVVTQIKKKTNPQRKSARMGLRADDEDYYSDEDEEYL
jgi:hypothetical protein